MDAKEVRSTMNAEDVFAYVFVFGECYEEGDFQITNLNHQG
jgi:hypothetical protein